MEETVRRRIAAVLLLAGVLLAAAAIADFGPFDDPPTEEERVTDAVEHFFGAAADGDGKEFCTLLTRDARKTLQVNVAQRLQTDDPPSCAKLLKVLAPVFEGSTIDVRQVSVSGFRARVEARYKLKGSGAEPRTILLSQQDGKWYVSDPG